jgi:hypothetical protein
MNHIAESVRGLSFIVRLNLDRLLFVGAVFAALALAAYVAHP